MPCWKLCSELAVAVVRAMLAVDLVRSMTAFFINLYNNIYRTENDRTMYTRYIREKHIDFDYFCQYKFLMKLILVLTCEI